jgi:hypothetical protein
MFHRVTAIAVDSSLVERETHYCFLILADLLPESSFYFSVFLHHFFLPQQMKGTAMQSLAALHNMPLKM